MHYQNGRSATTGDAVIGRSYPNGPVIAGVIHSLQPGSTSCNAQVAVPTVGGIQSPCITVGNFVHAEDALAAFEASLPKTAESAPA